LADILFVVICMANSQGVDLESSLQEAIAKVWKRDRNRYAQRESRPDGGALNPPQG
jgi:NTP pyrophosphatase (non-canonical NTP hydrolase)